ncbi:MAG: hypothetical protein IKV87_03165 [Methanobrevibacter sp.]|nr:hypothetical protein [Methanobrevibacter sp.]
MLMIDEFRKEMEKPKEIYTKELERFAERYDFLGEFTIVEERDFDTLDYHYVFNNLNGTSRETIKSARKEIYDHMIKFSEDNGIDEFSENAYISFKR